MVDLLDPFTYEILTIIYSLEHDTFSDKDAQLLIDRLACLLTQRLIYTKYIKERS